METVTLGKTGIKVSKLGIGTGTSHPSGCFAQALMSRKELSDLLIFAFEKGITFWDTAFQYNTYPHIKEALQFVDRSSVILSTKLITSDEESTMRDYHASLKALNIDYFDICLLHGVRKETEFRRRAGAFNALLRLKHMGKVRAVGLSSHGLSALKSVLKNPEIEVVWARTNIAGVYMDTYSLGLYDRLATVPCLKKMVKLFPNRIKEALTPQPEKQVLSSGERNAVEETLEKIHAQSKGVVGMKVLIEGYLRKDVKKAIEYVRDLHFVDAMIIGMMSRNEIEQNCRILSGS